MLLKRLPFLLFALTAAILAQTMTSEGSEPKVGKTPENLTKQECSDCHMAYQAGFLPIRSWQAIMADLPNHFGEDASLDAATVKEIEQYLIKNAADRKGKNPRWLKAIPKDVTPMRISQFPWFRHEHGKRVNNWIKANPSVGSVSNCPACHKGADRGYFDDD